MVLIRISLTSSSTVSHVPLAALGYALRRAGVLAPLDEVVLPMKIVSHPPSDKVLEALVLILAGGRAIAQAWGQAQFAQQSMLSEALDAFDDTRLTPSSKRLLRR